MSDYLPKIGAAAPFTATTSAAVTGGRLVVVSGAGTVAHAAADAAAVVGIAAFDAKSGERVTVLPRGGIHRLTASGAIAAGAQVAADAAGKVQTIASNENPVGVALTAAAAANDILEIVIL